MPFEVRVQRVFCAGHQVRMHDGSLEPVHGHNWNVTVTVGADKLDAAGFVVDFHDLERQLDGVIGGFNNRHLNDLPTFSRLNPSTENVALAVAQALKLAPPA